MTANQNDATIEVELKFRLDDADAFRRAIREIGAAHAETIKQRDVYFAHPVRDFAETDEALRIRITNGSGRMTFKGPRFDADTKSRHETEIEFAGGAEDAERFGQVLEQLGFERFRTVVKEREMWNLTSAGGVIEISIDTVEGLGTFVELERSVPAANFGEAKTAIQSLADKLGLTAPEHCSYLGLLLARDHQAE